jgi:glutamate racemase
MFDSGVGGLTVLHECLVSLPGEDFVYLGDTARFPYGTRPAEELRSFVADVAGYLLDLDAKLLVIACNSATSAGADEARRLAEPLGVPVVTVIEPEAEIAAAITESGKVGVLATPTTVAGGAYRRALEGQGRALEVTEVGCPDLAPIIQRDATFDHGVIDTVRGYVKPLKQAQVDTVILGCTHYPLVAPLLQRILGRDVRVVMAGHAVAASVQRILAERGLDNPREGEGDYRFLCTSDADSFREIGTRFLQMPLGEVRRVDLRG